MALLGVVVDMAATPVHSSNQLLTLLICDQFSEERDLARV